MDHPVVGRSRSSSSGRAEFLADGFQSKRHAAKPPSQGLRGPGQVMSRVDQRDGFGSGKLEIIPLGPEVHCALAGGHKRPCEPALFSQPQQRIKLDQLAGRASTEPEHRSLELAQALGFLEMGFGKEKSRDDAFQKKVAPARGNSGLSRLARFSFSWLLPGLRLRPES